MVAVAPGFPRSASLYGSGRYNLCIGGDHVGTRLNEVYRENLDEAGIISTLDELFEGFSKNRNSGEHFGDFAVRSGWVTPKAA